jgi:O-antigen/teichoic acid export membrane protein
MDKKLLVSSFTLVTITNIITKPLWVFLFIYSARKLGVEQYGLYTYLNSIVLTVGVLVDCGFDYLLIREVTQNNNPRIINTVLYTRVALFFVLLLFFLLLFGLGIFDFHQFLIILLLLVFNVVTFLVNSVKSAASAFHLFKDFSIILLIEKAAVIVIGLLALLVFSKLVYFAAALVLGILSAFYFSFKMLKRLPDFRAEFISWELLKKLFVQARYLIFLNILVSVYFRLDVLILRYFLDDINVIGLYGSVHRLIEMYILFPTIIMSAGYPIIAKFTAAEDVKYVLEKLFSLLLIVSIPLSFIFSFNSEAVNHLIYGAEYAEGARGLQYIIWAIIPIGFNYVIGNLFISIRKEYYSIRSLAVGCVVSILLNFILIPKVGYPGAAISVLMAEFAILAVNTYFVSSHFGFELLRNLFAKSFIILGLLFLTEYLLQPLMLGIFTSLIWQLLLSLALLFGFGILKPAYITFYVKNLSFRSR